MRGGRPPALRPEAGSFLSEIAGLALDALALFAFRYVLDFTVLENGLHLDFSAAGAEKVMGRARTTSVLGNLCHCVLLGKTR